jgi:hypothetical protein
MTTYVREMKAKPRVSILAARAARHCTPGLASRIALVTILDGRSSNKVYAHSAQGKMITIKQLTNDLITMEKQNLIKKAGYKYKRAGDPEQRYELTEDGSNKFWAFELANISDADKTTLERCGYDVTAQGLKLYIEETQP